MLQHLLNTTAIWLLSLLAFDVFLKKESYHGYNRTYLLITFCLGIFLPLYQIENTTVIYSAGISAPMAQFTEAKRSIIDTAPTILPHKTIDWIQVLYYAGVTVSLLLLTIEIIKLITLYKKGKRSKDGVWTIIETGRGHTPFSAFRYVFISSKGDYNATHLRMILTHEEQHGHALHFFDLTLMQVAKIIFWFHPLVYIYHNRLLLLHEYQADAAIENATDEYGRFLVEQSLLQAAPSLSHSFNRSPIKNRILMLTSKSAALSKSKMLIAAPLVTMFVLCFTKNALSDDTKTRNGNIITYKGNRFELGSVKNDTVFVENPNNGNIELLISQAPAIPVKMNNEKIYLPEEIKNNPTSKEVTMQSQLSGNVLREYLLTNMKDELKNLENGFYFLKISNVVINKEGKIVYYDYGGITSENPMFPANKNEPNRINRKAQDIIDKKVVQLMNEAPKHWAAVINGKEVISLAVDRIFWNGFHIKNGKLESL